MHYLNVLYNSGLRVVEYSLLSPGYITQYTITVVRAIREIEVRTTNYTTKMANFFYVQLSDFREIELLMAKLLLLYAVH